jgi:hypothetical protein
MIFTCCYFFVIVLCRVCGFGIHVGLRGHHDAWAEGVTPRVGSNGFPPPFWVGDRPPTPYPEPLDMPRSGTHNGTEPVGHSESVLVVTFPDDSLQIALPCGEGWDGCGAASRPENSLFKGGRVSAASEEGDRRVLQTEGGRTDFAEAEEEGQVHGADVVSAARAADHGPPPDGVAEIELPVLPEQATRTLAEEREVAGVTGEVVEARMPGVEAASEPGGSVQEGSGDATFVSGENVQAQVPEGVVPEANAERGQSAQTQVPESEVGSEPK